MSHSSVVNGDNPVAKSAQSSLAFSTISSTNSLTNETCSSNKPSRSNLSLNFGQAGQSAKKRNKIETYLQETPGK